VAVDRAGRAVGSPAGVCDGTVVGERLVEVGLGLGNVLAESGDLANLLVQEYFAWLVAIKTHPRAVVAAVLEP